jgi:hypothetical protein
MSRQRTAFIVGVLVLILFASIMTSWSSTISRKRSRVVVPTARWNAEADIISARIKNKQAATALPRGAVNDDSSGVTTHRRLPVRFKRNKHWAPETPAEVVPLTGAPPNFDGTTVQCSGGADAQSRTCRIYNVCFDAEIDDGGSREDSMVLFTGTGVPVEKYTITAGGQSVPFTQSNTILVYHGTMFDGR